MTSNDTCTYYHTLPDFIDFKFCPKCEPSRCVGCGTAVLTDSPFCSAKCESEVLDNLAEQVAKSNEQMEDFFHSLDVEQIERERMLRSL